MATRKKKSLLRQATDTTAQAVAKAGVKSGIASIKARPIPQLPNELGIIQGQEQGANILQDVSLRRFRDVGPAIEVPSARSIPPGESTLGNLGTGLLNAGAGFAGSKVAGAFVPPSKESNIASAVGGAIGSVAGPVGAFAGATIGGLVGAIFGGERLSDSERVTGEVFKQIKSQEPDFDKSITLTALNQPEQGFDSVGDSAKELGGADNIGGGDRSAFVRRSFFRGLSKIIKDGDLSDEEILGALRQNKGIGDPNDPNNQFAIISDGLKENISIKLDFPELLPTFLKAGVTPELLGVPAEFADMIVEAERVAKEEAKQAVIDERERNRIKPITGTEQSTELFAQLPQNMNFAPAPRG